MRADLYNTAGFVILFLVFYAGTPCHLVALQRHHTLSPLFHERQRSASKQRIQRITFCKLIFCQFAVRNSWNWPFLELTLRHFAFAGLYLCIGDPFLPGQQGSAWAILIVWLGGHIGAFLAELVRYGIQVNEAVL